MKKLLVLIMASVMTLSLVACGGGKTESTSTPAEPTSATKESTPTPEQSKEAEYTKEQLALIEEFSDMAEAFNKTIDRVNASPELLSDEELVTNMNELVNDLNILDGYLGNPELLTPEVIDSFKTSIESCIEFVNIADAALDEIDEAKANQEVQSIVVPVEIFNDTGIDIYGLAISPSNSEEWGENLITEVIKSGETVLGEFQFTSDTLVWDILVQDANEDQLVFMGVDFSEANSEGAKLVLQSTENGEYVAYVN